MSQDKPISPDKAALYSLLIALCMALLAVLIVFCIGGWHFFQDDTLVALGAVAIVASIQLVLFLGAPVLWRKMMKRQG